MGNSPVMHAVRGLSELPLAVDLDRTLVRTDVGVESLIALCFTRPALMLRLPGWGLRGLAYAKRKIIENVSLDFDSLPVNQAVLDFIGTEVVRGRRVLLVTASDQAIADGAAKRFGFFSEAVGSDGTHNLKGPNKADYLVKRFGERGFTYVGDSSADQAVWKRAGGAVVVDYRDGARASQAAKLCPVEYSFLIAPQSNLSVWAKQLRVHQWAKNLLLILPIILAHQIFNVQEFIKVLWGIAAFSLIASTVYILNDVSDLEADRSHPKKKWRPFASGALKVESAFVACVILLGAALAILGLIIPQMAGIAALYFLITCVYTWWGKEQLGLDVMMLAALYCIRIIAGGVVANIALSQWLLTFASFLFLSLACVKRVAELNQSKTQTNVGVTAQLKRRAYTTRDLPALTALGVGAGLLSVLVCALYFSSAEVTALYRNPEVLFSGVLPVMTFWVARLWLLAGRGSDELEDPVLYAVSDRVSLICAGLCAVLVWMAV